MRDSTTTLIVTEFTSDDAMKQVAQLRKFLTTPPNEFLADRDKLRMFRAIASAKVLVCHRLNQPDSIAAALVTYDHTDGLVELGSLRVHEEGYGIGSTLIALAIAKETIFAAPERIVAVCRVNHPSIPKQLEGLGFQGIRPTATLLAQMEFGADRVEQRRFFDLPPRSLRVIADKLTQLGSAPWLMPHKSGGGTIKVELQIRGFSKLPITQIAQSLRELAVDRSRVHSAPKKSFSQRKR